MLDQLVRYVVLPGSVTDFERNYLARMNRVGFWFFALHVPVFMLIAYLNGQSVPLALGLTSFVLVGPFLAERTSSNARFVAPVYGFTAMLMGGLLAHFGQGPVQIEMHFYFFALLAMLAIYGNPLAIVVAAVTVALHHVLAWMFLPSSVFNYAAPLWVVLVHAAFVVLESIATCFIARSFFDNVIGLEKIVKARTEQLDARNRDMRLVLDTVNQGLFTIDRSLAMSSEMSAVVTRWFGPVAPGQTFATYIDAYDPVFASSFHVNWDQVIADMLPLELTLDQLPKRMAASGRHYSLQYTPIQRDGTLDRLLVMISDITVDVERERLEAEQHDVLHLLRGVAKDKGGVLEFMSEATVLVNDIVDPVSEDAVLLKRQLHTLKGNAMIFGVQTVAGLCHALESFLDERGELPSVAARSELQAAWNKVCLSIDMLLGSREHPRIEIDDTDYESLLRAIVRGESYERVAEQLRAWKLEPSARRLMRAGEQAQSIAQRLNKGGLQIVIEDHAVRLDRRAWAGFWTALVHVIRNAIDHGIESPEERKQLGKPVEGCISFSTRIEGDKVVIQVEDDGRGIDWSAIARRAQKLGLPHVTERDLTEALFADGLTTRSDVSEYSGRGVGMGVVREECRARGGTIRVDSQPGKGTRVEFRFPTQQPAVQHASPSSRAPAPPRALATGA